MFLGGFGFQGGLLSAMNSLSDAMADSTLIATSRISSMHHSSGETNRYDKIHREKVVTPQPMTKRPSDFAGLPCTPYKHPALTSDRYIRLLRLLPEKETEDLISCRIEDVELDATLHYEALSYTWGTLPRDFPILIAQDVVTAADTTHLHALFASPSLYAALRRLRKTGEERLLWIDQLCINQDDPEEKSAQVKLMADIYEIAQRTIIWLGEEDEDSGVLSEMIHLFTSHYPGDPDSDITLLRPRLNLSDIHPHPPGQWSRKPLTRLLNRSWFGRAWVFQEAVKSARVIILCGSLEMPLDILLRLTQAAFTIEEDERGYAHSLTKSTTGFDMLYLIQHSRSGGCGHQDCERRIVEPSFLGLLMQVLQQVEATDPRDLIYAFMAFKRDVYIDPIYTVPVSITWREAATSIIKATSSLDIFAAVPGNTSIPPSQSQTLPSWVPDWSSCYPYARPISAPDFKSVFTACNALLHPHETLNHTPCPHIWLPSPDPNTLIVQGRTIGTATWSSPQNFEGSYYREGLRHVLQLQQHLAHLTRYLRLCGELGAAALRASLDERVLMRTLLADGAFGHVQPLPDELEALVGVCEAEESIEREVLAAGAGKLQMELRKRKALLARARQWSLIAQMKRVFLSQSQGEGAMDLGLAPRCVQKGDVVVLLRGSRTPCLLRGVGEGRWRVVGQCYLDGWMYGEAPPGRRLRQGEEERFVLV